MLLPKRLVYTLQGLRCLFFIFLNILSKTDRSEVQIDSKDTVVSSTLYKSTFESSNSGRIRRPGGGDRLDFSNSFEFGGFKKHSYKLDYQDKFLVSKHSL